MVKIITYIKYKKSAKEKAIKGCKVKLEMMI